jgi:5'(3')-deoxyribonucleotidase
MEKIVVYFDMDGVLARHPGAKNGDVNFHELAPIEEMVSLYKKLAQDPRCDVYLASTAPWSAPEAWVAKRLWVEKYLGDDAYKRLILTHHKNMLIGDILIDDRDANGAKDFKGQWIQYIEGGEITPFQIEMMVRGEWLLKQNQK